MSAAVSRGRPARSLIQPHWVDVSQDAQWLTLARPISQPTMLPSLSSREGNLLHFHIPYERKKLLTDMASSQDVFAKAKTTGYHRLADMMGPYPDIAIFRRFGPLNMLNLLSLQAELVELEADLRDIWSADNDSQNEEEQEFATYFRSLRKSEGGPNDGQYQMLLEIRRKLLEYSTQHLHSQIKQRSD